MSSIEIRGVQHYYQWLPEDSGSVADRPVFIFLHGWGGSSRYWETTALSLSDRFNCLLYDLRGFGRSRLPQDSEQQTVFIYELEDYASDLLALMDALGIEQAFINAHSMGASILVFFLERYSHRVQRAVLTCSGIFEYEAKAFAAFHRFGRYVVQFRPPWLAKIPLADRLFMARFLYRSLPSPVSQAFLEDFLQADYEAALGTLYTSVSKEATESMPRAFSNVSVPTLLVAGEHDKIIPAAMGEQAAALNPQIEFALIPDTAHFPMLEDPTTYLELLNQFLKV